MNATECTGSLTRADAQRDRILCAALKCFIEAGFHGASMAHIAEVAQMSPGLIYRYFENKQAIVLAIVQRQLEEKQALIGGLRSSAQLAADLLRVFEEWCSGAANSSVALFLEMSAEATRNPVIADALRVSDELTRAEFEKWLARPREAGGMAMPAAEAARCALEMRFIVDGLAVRSAREPRIDREDLRTALQSLVARIIPAA